MSRRRLSFSRSPLFLLIFWFLYLCFCCYRQRCIAHYGRTAESTVSLEFVFDGIFCGCFCCSCVIGSVIFSLASAFSTDGTARMGNDMFVCIEASYSVCFFADMKIGWNYLHSKFLFTANRTACCLPCGENVLLLNRKTLHSRVCSFTVRSLLIVLRVYICFVPIWHFLVTIAQNRCVQWPFEIRLNSSIARIKKNPINIILIQFSYQIFAANRNQSRQSRKNWNWTNILFLNIFTNEFPQKDLLFLGAKKITLGQKKSIKN